MAASCAAYDAGDHSEALRLATCVYNIVHDHGAIHSIMAQLGIKETHKFLATNIRDATCIQTIVNRYTPLIELERLYVGPTFVPLCTYFENRNAWFYVRGLSFDAWWNKDIIFFDGPQRLTRRQLVFTLRNQEGGSHYDKEVRNPTFHSLQKSFVFFHPSTNRISEQKNLELASMRQVAEELELSFAINEPGQHPNMKWMTIDELEERAKRQQAG